MHILIVEDDAKVAEFVSEGFRREGHAVTLARDGFVINIHKAVVAIRMGMGALGLQTRAQQVDGVD